MAAEECFEKLSRSIFNFNMGLDNAIIEPIAKRIQQTSRAN